jgi:DNA-binding NarL/FixJ family response regulator
MPKQASLSLCLISSHPLVLAELEQLLRAAGVSVKPLRLEAALTVDPRRVRVPRSRLYVVDDFGTRPATEALVATILTRTPHPRVLVVGDRFTEANSFPLLRLGVKGLVPYGQARQQLPEAVRATAAGGFWVPRKILSRFVDWVLESLGPRRWTFGPAYLSPREQEVLEALLANLSNKEIAQRLSLAERTVKFHVSNVLGKFGVQRRSDLILLYWQSRPGAKAGALAARSAPPSALKPRAATGR